ncbi:MAG TPA: DUF4405 domain-containing protein [Opitutaceae bacterium]|nr:DUF4405 domain-containing protein [Opitutaceae bacterium]
MKSTVLDKTWLSPFVGVAFLVIAATGMLLFFHVKSGPIIALHEWFGWLFIVAGAVHVLLNLRPLLAYLRRPLALVSIGAAVVLVALLWAGGARHEREHHSRVYGAAASNSSAIP